jgi:hypothetical protein
VAERKPCGYVLSWWDGEYEGECIRPEDHTGDHFDGMSWCDEETGEEGDPPEDWVSGRDNE